MFRTVFLFLSRRRGLRRWVETSQISRSVTRRFVAGQTLEEAVEVCRRLHAGGYLSTLDHLGENVTTKAEAEASRNSALDALRALKAAGLNSTISIKLTQFGLDLSTEFCQGLVMELAGESKSLGLGVEVDMESSEYTDQTLRIVHNVNDAHGCVRAVLQSYLFRTEKDAKKLCEAGIKVRLCKGAYDEAGDVAFSSKQTVDENYLKVAKLLLDEGQQAALATHDPAMINATLEHVEKRGIQSGEFEFQMLYGVRRDLQAKLTAAGWRVRLYVPYGKAWYPYFMRRLAERPANVLFLARNFFRK